MLRPALARCAGAPRTSDKGDAPAKAKSPVPNWPHHVVLKAKSPVPTFCQTGHTTSCYRSERCEPA
jgi:hypothetical protein